MCIEPPRPRQTPVSLASNSAIISVHVLAFGNGVTMPAVGGDDVVVAFAAQRWRRRRRLPDRWHRCMVPCTLPRRILLEGGFLKGTNQDHLFEHLDELVAIETEGRCLLHG